METGIEKCLKFRLRSFLIDVKKGLPFIDKP